MYEHEKLEPVVKLCLAERPAMAHGCYRLLLDEMWKREGELPANREILWVLAKCKSRVQYEEVADLVEGCFRRSEDGTTLTSELLTAEWDSATEILEKKREAGRKGGQARVRHSFNYAQPQPKHSLSISKQDSSTPQASSSNSISSSTENAISPIPLSKDGYPTTSDDPVIHPAFDGQEAFTTTVDLFPEKDGGRLLRDYSHRAQVRHQEAIAEIQQSISCSAPEATDYLKGKIREYLAGAKPGYHKSFLGFLDSKPWRNTPPETNGAAPPGFAWFRDGDERVLLPV